MNQADANHITALRCSVLLSYFINVLSQNTIIRIKGFAKLYCIEFQTALDGNADRNSIVKNVLNPPVKARYVQINPKEWNSDGSHNTSPDICMRAALFRCNGRMGIHVELEIFTVHLLHYLVTR